MDSKALQITLANRKSQKPVLPFQPERKVKMGSVENAKGDYKTIDSGRLLCALSRLRKENKLNWNKN